MTTSTTTRVEPHPLGVVVRQENANTGELIIPGESWHGHPFEELERLSHTTGVVPPDEPLHQSGDRSR
jgi:hypothetical protein